MRSKLIFFMYFVSSPCIAQVFVPLGNGFNNAVRSITIDTNTNTVFAGGNFSFSGVNPISGIAQWNGVTWNALGMGSIYPGAPVVASMIYQNQLICSGTFSDGVDSTGNGLGLWTGNNWMNIGNVFTSSGNLGSGGIYAFKEFGGLLYMMGDLDQINGIIYNRLATWDGTNYAGFPAIDQSSTSIYTCQFYNNKLYVGGNFMSSSNSLIKDICWFDGTDWQPAGNGLNGLLSWINCMTVFQGDLYVAGWFSEALGDPGNNIARWDGSSWHSLGTGLDYSVFAMEVFNNELYVGGQFTNAGGIPVNKIAKWNGSQWDSVPNANFNNSVLCLASYNNDLYIGGGFTEVNGNPVNFIGKYSILTGIEDNNNVNYSLPKVYPKLSDGVFHIQSGSASLEKVDVFDCYGKKNELSLNENETKFDLSEFSPGIYFISIYTKLGIVNNSIFLVR